MGENLFFSENLSRFPFYLGNGNLLITTTKGEELKKRSNLKTGFDIDFLFYVDNRFPVFLRLGKLYFQFTSNVSDQTEINGEEKEYYDKDAMLLCVSRNIGSSTVFSKAFVRIEQNQLHFLTDFSRDLLESEFSINCFFELNPHCLNKKEGFNPFVYRILNNNVIKINLCQEMPVKYDIEIDIFSNPAYTPNTIENSCLLKFTDIESNFHLIFDVRDNLRFKPPLKIYSFDRYHSIDSIKWEEIKEGYSFETTNRGLLEISDFCHFNINNIAFEHLLTFPEKKFPALFDILTLLNTLLKTGLFYKTSKLLESLRGDYLYFDCDAQKTPEDFNTSYGYYINLLVFLLTEAKINFFFKKEYSEEFQEKYLPIFGELILFLKRNKNLLEKEEENQEKYKALLYFFDASFELLVTAVIPTPEVSIEKLITTHKQILEEMENQLSLNEKNFITFFKETVKSIFSESQDFINENFLQKIEEESLSLFKEFLPNQFFNCKKFQDLLQDTNKEQIFLNLQYNFTNGHLNLPIQPFYLISGIINSIVTETKGHIDILTGNLPQVFQDFTLRFKLGSDKFVCVKLEGSKLKILKITDRVNKDFSNIPLRISKKIMAENFKRSATNYELIKEENEIITLEPLFIEKDGLFIFELIN